MTQDKDKSKLLERTRAVITGASTGLGKEVAELFAGKGADVAILARREKELIKVADAIEKAGGTCVCLPTDVGDYEQVKNAFQEIKRFWGKMDVLINNAAITGPISEVGTLNTQDWDMTIKINLSGPFYCVKEALDILANGHNSCIINVTSSLATLVWPRFMTYGVTKGGLNSMTVYLAEELKSFNIRVFGMDPGAMDTPMWQNLQEMSENQLGKSSWGRVRSFNKRLASPQILARLALFLATKAPMELSGKTGGYTFFEKHGFK